MSRGSRQRRRFVRLALAGTATLALMAVVNVGPVAGSSPLTQPPTLAESHEIALRAQFGLQKDLAYVRATDSAATSTTADLSIPLTPAEHVEMVRRDQLSSAVASIDKQFTGADPTYIGAWLDQASGGILNVSFTADPSQQISAQLQAFLPVGGAARVTVKPTSLATLTAVKAKVSEDMLRNLSNKDMKIISVGVDASTDSVAIMILKDSPNGVEAAILARYGPTLTITRGEPIRAH